MCERLNAFKHDFGDRRKPIEIDDDDEQKNNLCQFQ